jgi:predicted DNA-binding transcriptional regulator AlpA
MANKPKSGLQKNAAGTTDAAEHPPRYGALFKQIAKVNDYLDERARRTFPRDACERARDELQFLRVKEVCQLLRISKPTLWRLRRANAFPRPTELSDRVIGWRKIEIEAWLQARSSLARQEFSP